MNNTELADIFERIASLLEIKGEIVYKILAYHRAAESLRVLTEDVSRLREEGRLEEIPGVGKAISEKIEELLETGELKFLLRLEQEIPVSLLDILKIPDIGPKRVALFWRQADITNLDELEIAAQEGRLKNLPGMGEKSEKRLLEGIRTYRRSIHRIPLPVARSIVRRWLQWIKEQPGVIKVEAAGSLRRWKTSIGDLDLVMACNNPAPVMDAFVRHKDVQRILAQGESKSSVELADGLRVQLWQQPAERFGSLLQFVTGSKAHNVRLRELAQKRGLSLSERGLLDSNGKEHFCTSEEEVYERIGLPWIPPELREDRGEFQAAQEGRLPSLIRWQDLTADLHTHTILSDGEGSITEMVLEAKRLGWALLAVTDHSCLLKVDEKGWLGKLKRQRDEIEEVRRSLGEGFTLLHGAEVDILPDGSLDYPDEILQWLDVVVVSLHSELHQPRQEITTRLLKAIRNPHVDIVAHPSGRALPYYQGADLDWEAVFEAAKECNVALEINANPCHLDLDEFYARKAVERGILLCINTDAHAPRQLNREYGIGVARRAWVQPEQSLTAWPAKKIVSWLREHRNDTAKL